MHNGMYAPLSRSYLNLSASRCYKMFNLLSHDSKESLWNLLYDEYAEKLDWYNKAPEDFENEDVCEFANLVCKYNYKEYKRRLSRTKESKPQSEKKKGLFAKLFCRK